MEDDPIESRLSDDSVIITVRDDSYEAFLHPHAEGEVWKDGEKVFKTTRAYDAPYPFDIRVKVPEHELDAESYKNFMRDVSSILGEKFESRVENSLYEVDSMEELLEESFDRKEL